ncbi:hypothetical protein OIU84_024174 [Salix udensis]|uniref:PORR domain-containing protein n=1 Tax=Salix udensis TaxID=889485 RepID=A0AAD6KGU8_9ROSI|nr:hypothetical protein OIU84_024174 [Salix udensis]
MQGDLEIADPKARKRVAAVLHELLSLTFGEEDDICSTGCFFILSICCHLDYCCLIKHHGIFYITNKGARSTVFLKDCYDGSNLIEKCPLLSFHDKFVALSGRAPVDSCTAMPSSQLFT